MFLYVRPPYSMTFVLHDLRTFCGPDPALLGLRQRRCCCTRLSVHQSNEPWQTRVEAERETRALKRELSRAMLMWMPWVRQELPRPPLLYRPDSCGRIEETLAEASKASKLLSIHVRDYWPHCWCIAIWDWMWEKQFHKWL